MDGNYGTKKIFILFILFSMIPFFGCSNDYGPVKRSWGKMKGLEDMVGNMRDTSYSRVRTMKPRLNARQHPVAMENFEGQFVWAEYVAPWCSTSALQTPETKKVKAAMQGRVDFLTIMTGSSRKYNDHASVATARQWSDRFALDPERVLSAELWFKTIPEHRLFSPQGHTLFVHVGYLNAEQIKEAISYYRTGWENWYKNGETAEWMTFK